MDPETELRREHSKAQTLRIVEWVGVDAGRFARLVGLMTGGDALLEQRAAWVVGHCVKNQPALGGPQLDRLLANLGRSGLHPAVVRNTFRLLQYAPIPAELEGEICGIAMAAIGGVAPVAVKAYAMTVLKRLVGRYPEIMGELRLLIEEQWPEAGPAFRSRARREFGVGLRN